MNYKIKYKKYTRPFYIFNCGSSQDARALFIGNMFYNKEIGTYFNQSAFVKAIQIKNSIIILDELSRLTHDGMNILIPILDPTQRCLRLDEDENSSIIRVAEGVCFIATTNIGSEYTATKVIDKALSGRFPIKIEMEPLNADELKKLFAIKFKGANKKQFDLMDTLADISEDIRIECIKEDANITSLLSPRSLIKMAELVLDGFTLKEIAEVAIYTEYPDDGGSDSERTFKNYFTTIFPSRC
jgi:MoxR-like ATPase